MPTILITGANRGLGFELAHQYAAHGWRVLAACRDTGTAKALRVLPGDVAVHRLDLAIPDHASELAEALSGEAIDVLVSNAAMGSPERTALGDMDYRKWEEAFRINAIAPFRLAEAFQPHVAASSRRVMLFVSTRAASISDMLSAGRYVYRSSKAALNAVVKSLAIDLLPKRIICVALHPGWVRTDMGGPEAPIAPAASVAAIRALVDRLEPHHNGRFLNYDGGELRW
jgi:NAD(P)-dependent dehydrogenase (short-subunit alcohol dehydrogenase family)